MAKMICVAGPYHGQKAEEAVNSNGRITLDGVNGPITYVLRHRPMPHIAIYVPEGAAESEILQGLVDLAPA